MTHAFILMIDVGSDTDFPSYAEDLESDLTAAGHNVVYVHPWTSPGESGLPFVPPALPPPAPLHIPTPTPTIPFT